MQNPKRERIDFIDFARGFSILGVVFYHCSLGLVGEPWSKVMSYGGFGVHMFVILSGFGLSISSRFTSVKNFYKRRFLKILLPYYLFICLVFICNQFILVYPNDGLYAFFGHILFYKMFDESIITSFGYYLWFLSMIIQLYLAYPVLFKVHKYWGNYRFGFLVFIISLSWLLLIAFLKLENMRTFNSFSLTFLWEFGLGMILGNLFKEKQFVFWKIKNYLMLLTSIILGGAIAAILSAKAGSFGSTLNIFPAALSFTALTILVYSLSSNPMLSRLRASIIFIGNISYELYLIHGFLLTATLRFLFSSYNSSLIIGLNFLLVLPVAIVLSLMFSRLNAKLYRLFK